MKNYRMIVPVVMAVLMVLSWYMLISETISDKTKYNNYLESARAYAKDGISKYAIQNYEEALAMKDDPNTYVEIINYYKSQEEASLYLEWCEAFFENHSTEPKAYDCILTAYQEEQDYKAVYEVLEAAEKRNIQTETINKISEELKYMFDIDYKTYSDVSIFSNNMCAIKKKDYWGFVTQSGSRIQSEAFKSVGDFTNSGLAPVVDMEGNAYFIDTEGYKVKVSKEKYNEFGNITQDIILAQKPNTQYVYLDMDFKQLFGEFDLGTSFNDGVAAIKNDKKWTLIDTKGKQVNNKTYVDVIRDDKEIVSRCERIFVAEKENQYKLVNTSGKELSSDTYEDAQLFLGEQPTAVNMNGDWFFITTEGKRISDKTYQDARPFMNGLAAVCINGKWGFVDEKENVVIEPQFEDAKAFNAKGCCFVKTGSDWQLIKLYRTNS